MKKARKNKGLRAKMAKRLSEEIMKPVEVASVDILRNKMRVIVHIFEKFGKAKSELRTSLLGESEKGDH